MRNDPQQFEHEKLPNGIDFYWHRHESPVCYIDFFLPVGSAHTGNDLLIPGSPHFLEHGLFLQSKNHLDPHSFELELSLHGCERGGTTYGFKTRYDIACPLIELPYASAALFETVFEPVFSDEALKLERGVIKNERDREKKYFPGRNRINQFVNTEFRHSSWVTIDQIFGTNQHLESVTAERMDELHKEYNFDSDSIVVAVGDSSFDELKALLSSVPTKKHERATAFTPSSWKNPAFRYEEIEGVKYPTYLSSWIRPSLPYNEYVALQFFLTYLTNYVHGPLYDEYRHKKGWTYGVSSFCDASNIETIYGFDLMLQEKDQIEEVRAHFRDIAWEGVRDQAKVEREIRRRLAFDAFHYQTSEDIVSGARYDILGGSEIMTYARWREELAKMTDQTWREQQFAQLFNEDSWGEVALMPQP